MPKYRVLKKYWRMDSTLIKCDAEEIEYPLTIVPFDCSKSAREYLKYYAHKNDMRIHYGKDWRITAEKETIIENPETGVITKEIESLRIEMCIAA